jgi:hypothetical protein
VGARQKISERLLGDLAEVWAEHGKSVLERLAKDEPAKLAQVAYGLLPASRLAFRSLWAGQLRRLSLK